MDSVLSSAEKLYLRGKYAKVLRLLEPQVFQYRDSYRFYLLLGYACLNTGDFGGGYSYLRRAEQLSPGDTAANLGIALVLAKRGETEEALRIWLLILDHKDNIKEASRGLKLVRDSKEFSEISIKIEEEKLEKYLRYPRRKKSPVKILLTFLLILIVTGGGFLAYRYLPPLFTGGISRPELKGIDFFSDESDSAEGSGRYALTEDEIKATAEGILDLMNHYRDNLAMREINRLLLSNASNEIKEKARFLTRYIQKPTFATLKDNFSFREVAADPRLYEGCHVIWSGRGANIEITEEAVLFDLLVGYEDETLLEGIVPVRLNFPINLSENRRLEVLARIELETEDSDTRIVANGISVHQLVEE